jgi:hypothetical protein
MQFLRKMRNTVKKFYWHPIYDGRANIQHVSVLRLKSGRIQSIPLKMMMTFRLGHIHRHNSHPNRSGHCPPAFSRVWFTLLQGAQGDRMTVGHHTSMTALRHLAFSSCISQTVTLFVVQTNRYYHRCMGSLDKGPFPQPDVTEVVKFYVAGNNNTNWTLPARTADRLLSKN